MVRLIDCNTEAFSDEDLSWADVVFTGGMMPQQADTLRLIEICRAAGKPVVIGGPDPTSSPHIYERADFQVLGEAESVLHEFVAAWDSGARSGVFIAPKFQADVTKTPVPRFDLLKFEDYLYRRRAVFARLPVHLRVLRHHRALWPGAANQDE